MTSDEYPYLTQLSVPDRLRLAAYVARDHGVPEIHLRAIMEAAEDLERLAGSLPARVCVYPPVWTPSAY